MKDEPITVEDYKLVSDEFFQKYNFVADRLGVTKKAADSLKVMEALSGAVMKDRAKQKVGPFGFNKQNAGSEEEAVDPDLSGSESDG